MKASNLCLLDKRVGLFFSSFTISQIALVEGPKKTQKQIERMKSRCQLYRFADKYQSLQ